MVQEQQESLTVIDRITEQWTRIDRLEIVILIGPYSVPVRPTSIRIPRIQPRTSVQRLPQKLLSMPVMMEDVTQL